MDINGYSVRNFLESDSIIYIRELSQNDLFEILHNAKILKTRTKFGEKINDLAGKNALLLTKHDLAKFRISFEVATRSLSGNPIVSPLAGNKIEEVLSNNYSLKVIARYGISCCAVDTDVITDAEVISKALALPVVNANETAGPCQALSVVMTVWEHFSKLAGLKATVIGDFTKTYPSILYTFAKCGIDIKLVCPKNLAPSDDIIDYVKQFAEIEICEDLSLAIKTSDIVFAYENDFGDSYKVTLDLLENAKPNAIYLQNVTETMTSCDSAVINSPKSKVFVQGENAMHVLRSCISLISK